MNRVFYVQYVLNEKNNSSVARLCDLAARAATLIGLPRSWGQVYSVLYLSPRPLGLEDLMNLLGLSKGAVSMTVRQLEQLGLLRRVWQQGDRRDYYEAVEDFRGAIRKFLDSTLKPRLDGAAAALDALEQDIVAGNGDPAAAAFRRARIRRLKSLRKKIASLLPLAESLLK